MSSVASDPPERARRRSTISAFACHALRVLRGGRSFSVSSVPKLVLLARGGRASHAPSAARTIVTPDGAILLPLGERTVEVDEARTVEPPHTRRDLAQESPVVAHQQHGAL